MLGQALAAITVLDFSQGIAGPYCACMLAELGARVIKIEPPEGDWGRYVGPRYGDSGVIFRSFNKGKKSIVLDLKESVARDAALRLADHADVFIESNRPGAMKRCGLDHEALSRRNPRLVYVSVTGFGQLGPYAGRAATDSLMQAFTGLSYAALGGEHPARIRLGVIDVSAGLYASHAVLAALIERGRSGIGQNLDINLTHAAAALQAYKIAEDAASAGAPQQELYAGIGTYRTRDGWLAVSAIREKHVIGLMELIGRSDLLLDPRFFTTEARLANQGALREMISAEILKMPTSYWSEQMQKADLMGQEVLDYNGFRGDSHVENQGIFQTVEFDGIGPLPTVRVPGLLREEAKLESSSELGRHTKEVLTEFGVPSADVAAVLQANGADRPAAAR